MTEAILLKDALTPSLLTEVLSLALLKPILSDVTLPRTRPSFCIEDCIQPGIYLLDANTTTSETPPSPSVSWHYGIMEVFARNVDIIQRITDIEGEMMFIRTRRNGKWKPWKRIPLEST